MPIRVQSEDFDVSQEVAGLRANSPQVGAVVTFIGTVRDMNDGSSVAEMELEHYPGMTEKALQNIVEQAKARWRPTWLAATWSALRLPSTPAIRAYRRNGVYLPLPASWAASPLSPPSRRKPCSCCNVATICGHWRIPCCT